MKDLTKDHNHSVKDVRELTDQLRVANENLKSTTEIAKSREKENNILANENKTLKTMMEDFKKEGQILKDDQNRLISNLRLQLDETKELVSKIKETKEREFRKLREKCDEEIRRETDKYQFEYDKLREEINMFQRRLGQEENFNKQMSVLNSKLNSNLSDLRGQYSVERAEEDNDYLRGAAPSSNLFYPPPQY